LLKLQSRLSIFNIGQAALLGLFSKRIQICIPIYGAKEGCQQAYRILNIRKMTYFTGRMHIPQRQTQQRCHQTFRCLMHLVRVGTGTIREGLQLVGNVCIQGTFFSKICIFPKLNAIFVCFL
jgi:hypothetical protein